MKTVCVNGMRFELHEDHAELCSAEAGLERAVIPDEVEGLPVTVLKSRVFARSKALQEVVFPKYLERIDLHCFEQCFLLDRLEFPESLKWICQGAFEYCWGLQSIHINSRCSLGDFAFSNCTSLRVVQLEDVTDLGLYVFHGCKKLEYITGDLYLSEIGFGAFWGCASLQRLDTCAKRVRTYALEGCDSLTHFMCAANCVLDPACGLSDLMNLQRVDGAGLDSDGLFVYTPDGRMVAHYVTSMTGTMELPDTITRLCENAFRDSKLRRVVLPETITSLPPSCFKNAVQLQEVIAPGVTKVAEGCFSGCISLEKVVTKPLKEVHPDAFKYCHHLQEIRLSPECSCIGSRAFMNCFRLRSVEAKGVEQVYPRAFASCVNLREMPDMPYLQAVGFGAFSGCPKLTHLEFPETLQVIKEYAFEDCSGLKSISFRGDASGKVHETAFDENFKNALFLDPELFYTDDDLWQMDEDEYEEDGE